MARVWPRRDGTAPEARAHRVATVHIFFRTGESSREWLWVRICGACGDVEAEIFDGMSDESAAARGRKPLFADDLAQCRGLVLQQLSLLGVRNYVTAHEPVLDGGGRLEQAASELEEGIVAAGKVGNRAAAPKISTRGLLAATAGGAGAPPMVGSLHGRSSSVPLRILVPESTPTLRLIPSPVLTGLPGSWACDA